MGRIRVVVNAVYKPLTRAFASLLSRFDSADNVLHDGRNTVKLMDFNGETLVVKRFKRLAGIKRLIYRFRKTKAFRSYKHALMLLDLGVSTPEPVAYGITYGAHGFPIDSFYISRYTPLPPLEDYFGQGENFDRKVVADFARFVVSLHHRGILFEDLNSTNVLVKTAEDGPTRFSLVDLNRMVFSRSDLSLNERFVNISRFCYDRPALFEYFVSEYLDEAARYGDVSGRNKPAKVRQAIKVKARCDWWRRTIYKIKHPRS